MLQAIEGTVAIRKALPPQAELRVTDPRLGDLLQGYEHRLAFLEQAVVMMAIYVGAVEAGPEAS